MAIGEVENVDDRLKMSVFSVFCYFQIIILTIALETCENKPSAEEFLEFVQKQLNRTSEASKNSCSSMIQNMKNVANSAGLKCYSTNEPILDKKKYAEQLLIQANLYKKISDEHMLRATKTIQRDPSNTEEIRKDTEVADGCKVQMLQKLEQL